MTLRTSSPEELTPVGLDARCGANNQEGLNLRVSRQMKHAMVLPRAASPAQ
jgi:hypothetical protein